MSEKSINSLLGMLATKKMPASGIQKTAKSSMQGNHKEISFLEKLVNSLNESQATDGQSATTIAIEKDDIAETEDINHLIKLLTLGLQDNKAENTNENNTNKNMVQLHPDFNQNMHGNKFKNNILVNSSNNQSSTAQAGTNTSLENSLINNQKLMSPIGPNTNTNIVQNQGKEIITELTQTSADKLNTTQSTTGDTKQLAKITNQEHLTVHTDQEQLPGSTITGEPETSLSDELNTNTKMMSDQKTSNITGNNGMTETASEGNMDESIHQLSKYTTLQPGNNRNKNRAKMKKAQSPVPAVETTGSNPISDAQKISGSKDINLGTSPQTDESTNKKTYEMLNEQHKGKALSKNTNKFQAAHQELAQTHIDSKDAPKIFEASAKTVDPTAAKLIDTTALTGDNDVKTVEAVMHSNTSSDSSTFNNQGANTDFVFNLKTTSNSQKTKTETNFNNTLSQVNNAAKPLGTLGNDVADNIIQNAKLYTAGGKSEIKMQLNPPELGTLKLEFSLDDDVLDTKITVERSSVKDVIEKDIPKLKELLTNSDIDSGKLDVSLQEKENGKQEFMDKNFHSNYKSKDSHVYSHQRDEYNEDNIAEEAMINNAESTQINYLV